MLLLLSTFSHLFSIYWFLSLLFVCLFNPYMSSSHRLFVDRIKQQNRLFVGNVRVSFTVQLSMLPGNSWLSAPTQVCVCDE